MDDTKGYRNNTIGVEMTWSLFTGGATQAAVQTATANKVDAENAYEQARRTIKENLTQAFHDHQTALAVLESRNAEERAALSAEIGVEKEHKLGERTVIELLNAKQELLKARVNRAKAQGEITITSYALLAAMGNLRIESEK